MSTPQYKLTYFNLRARGEIIRLVFAGAGVEYEDFRLDHSRWPALKPDTPFGQLPILEFDGHRLCQSNTIARYLANKYGLAGKTDLDKARADMIVDCMLDMDKPVGALFTEKDDAKRNELVKKMADETLPDFLSRLEKLLIQNNGGDGYFVGDSLTWADLSFVSGCGMIAFLGLAGQLDNYPKLSALKKRVEGLPKIAAWIAKRPVTEF